MLGSLRLLAFFVALPAARAFTPAASPDLTFIDSGLYTVTSITPNKGTRAGGTRVQIKGSGFNVNFFTAGNCVYIGKGNVGWAMCDVIEGACSVDCGGPS